MGNELVVKIQPETEHIQECSVAHPHGVLVYVDYSTLPTWFQISNMDNFAVTKDMVWL